MKKYFILKQAKAFTFELIKSIQEKFNTINVEIFFEYNNEIFNIFKINKDNFIQLSDFEIFTISCDDCLILEELEFFISNYLEQHYE